jgi:hypothetical protein
VGENDPTGAKLRDAVMTDLRDVEFLVGGFDFARVILSYYRAYLDGNDEQMSACMCWLRGEFASKTEARRALGMQVSVIIDDENWYDFIKLWAVLARRIGYRGLVVFIDECVNLYKIVHRVSRENNYEKILSMFNDALQGKAEGLLMVLGGTPQFLEDPRRGLFGYEALRSRLCDSRFGDAEFRNLIGPVIRLRRLSDDELFALIVRVSGLYAQFYKWEPRITAAQQQRFLSLSLARAGSDLMMTPRELLRDYLTVLNILMQNPDVDLERILSKVTAESRPVAAESEESAATVSEKAVFSPVDIEL